MTYVILAWHKYQYNAKEELHNMHEFLTLIIALLAVALFQIISEYIFDQMKWQPVSKMVNIACVVFCYLLLFRYVYDNFLDELLSFVTFGF